MNKKLSRREMIGTTASGVIAASAGFAFTSAPKGNSSKRKGNIHHSVSRWPYNNISLEEFAIGCKAIGIESIELLREEEWAVVQKHGLSCAVGYATDWGIPKGFNRIENHEKLIADFERMIPRAAKAGIPNLICFSGNRDGMDDQTGMINCAKGLRKLMPLAEKHKVTIIMELLNSKRNHKDYQCDHTKWGAALCEMVGSERFKLLYDIYHMQIMEGDIIDTIKELHPYIGHYHTGGVPGRNELDETQEIYYPAVMKAIIETGYTGYVGQEFVPSKADKMASLKQAIDICDV